MKCAGELGLESVISSSVFSLSFTEVDITDCMLLS